MFFNLEAAVSLDRVLHLDLRDVPPRHLPLLQLFRDRLGNLTRPILAYSGGLCSGVLCLLAMVETKVVGFRSLDERLRNSKLSFLSSDLAKPTPLCCSRTVELSHRHP